MPEMPEVETLRALLERRVGGARIVGARFAVEKILRQPDVSAFCEAVAGARIEAVQRRGKYLLFRLSGAGAAGDKEAEADRALIVHLKMRGMLRAEPISTPPGPYFCAELSLDNGQGLRYYDMWRWGEWSLHPWDSALRDAPGLKALGPEPLEPAFTEAGFAEAL